MSESVRNSIGRKVVSRATAEELGAVGHLFVDGQLRKIAAIVIGRGEEGPVCRLGPASGFGADAVMVADESSLRAPVDDRERSAVEGKMDRVGKRTLSERGNELGSIDDVTSDEGSGALEDLVIGDRRVPAGALLGSGSYAAVLDKSQEA